MRQAYVFYAGGRDGWVVDPAELQPLGRAQPVSDQRHHRVCARRGRGRGRGADSVLLVTEPDFDACNTRNLSAVWRTPGPLGFRFDRSGAFFFISGDEDRCQKGRSCTSS
ncbi:hypothetical protein ZWY2020_004974 [Hordeum vulgare]|nr:hypothetical protein ZWY2020_004974 [Hordeum vulgare]